MGGNFLLLWLSQIISQFGDRFTQMALIGLIYKRAPGSAYELAKLFVFIVIPVFIVGPVAGAYSDRWNRKYTMIATDIIRGLLILSVLLYGVLIPTLRPIFPVYLIVFVIYSVTRFFIPAKMSIIPDIVPSDKLLEANSLINATGMIAAALGFGLGGIIISLPSVGVKGGLFIDAATFFISALLVSFINIKKESLKLKEDIYALGRQVKEVIVTSLPSEIREGLKYLFSHRRLHFIIILLFFLWSGVGAGYVTIIVFIQNMLGSITRDLGLLVMFFGAGLFLGSVAYGRLGRHVSKVRAIFLSLALAGVFLANFVVFVQAYRNFFLAAGIALLFGVSLSPIMILSNTIVHELIPNELRGRIFSSLEAVMHLAFLIFMILASILAETVGSFCILFTVGIIFALFGILGIRRFNA